MNARRPNTNFFEIPSGRLAHPSLLQQQMQLSFIIVVICDRGRYDYAAQKSGGNTVVVLVNFIRGLVTGLRWL
ncbi:hypothetical protein CPB84DRAFT_1143805 [Gymnopilus junonius]|uniref:Uncharacterized protein n=1 Tax=Gymnopilus junonius TaxID=109634 RepID=A0A9P5NLS7_GYMJU|nr:hypothetical protein CPB84DRAFT_1143805 [Gymnopilus junonius]